ncbi:MAG: biotin--[acetyl-CoA-carboxylase] ligase [Actinomycetia bacterium]|nr:biotin--[acetyl-CoA-carboxylase] ligase [Actinomycetes bacterium]
MTRWVAGRRYRPDRCSEAEWEALWAQGYRWIDEGTRRRLLDGPGLLTASRVERRAGSSWFHWVVLAEVDTTMRVARERLLAEGRPVAVVADHQRQGRGRRGRGWAGIPGGSLALSLGWAPPGGGIEGPLTLAVGVAAAAAVERTTGVRLGLKWPNDGMVGERKAMGILAEAGHDASPWVVVGIGINVNGSPPPEAPEATTLEAAAGRPFDRADLAVAVAAAVAEVAQSWSAVEARTRWLAAWRERSLTLGRPVRVVEADRSWVGFAEDVDADGALLVRRDDGTRVPVYAGDVSLRPAPAAG